VDDDDTLVGGTGADNLSGGLGDDTPHADDREHDPILNGRGGMDRGFHDGGLDPGARGRRGPRSPPRYLDSWVDLGADVLYTNVTSATLARLSGEVP
jgi:hypothetical protein